MRHLRKIRYGILTARRVYEPERLTSWQSGFLLIVGEPKSYLLDGRLEGKAYMEEANRYVWRKDRAALKATEVN